MGKISRKNWILIWILGMTGQICWNIENSWFNTFVYDKIAPEPAIVSWMVGGSIRDNIAYSKENATDEEVYQAAKAAPADHFIRTMPDGYSTILSDEIASLSQGQRQLLTIARAILADPAILILDEATSSVDTRTELEIQKAMDALMKGRTSFIIAHRLSTIRDVDHILVMKDGTIIEQGNHDELMKPGKFYADLYNSQFAAKAG